MDLTVEEEKAESLIDDQIDEMDEIDDPLFFRLVKMKALCLIINIRKLLKQKMVKIEGQKISIEPTHQT